MASHLSTPRSVREAPKLVPTFLHTTAGYPRKDRRAAAKASGFFKRTPILQPWKGNSFIVHPAPPFAQAFQTNNHPYTKEK